MRRPLFQELIISGAIPTGVEMIGKPHAIASNNVRAKPSDKLVKRKRCDDCIYFGISSFGREPNNNTL